MEINKCFYCMEDIPHGENICPHCGKTIGEKTQPEYALPCGAILHGKYLIGSVMGQGGFGITYIGYDLLLGVKVAIKEYYPMSLVSRSNSGSVLWSTQSISREEGCNNFLKEARKMAKLMDIPEVVSVKELFMENSTAYIVMEFVEGITLKTKLLQDGVMTTDAATALLIPIIRALKDVHEHGIIHRDISPDNIMINSKGEPRLLDLGAAKEVDMRTDQNKQSSQLVHKDGFSPPEQYMTGGDIGPWTDVYAMCATLYYAVTGKLVSPAVDRLASDSALEFSKNVPAWLQKTLVKGLSVNYKERYQDMGALLLALETKGAAEAAVEKKKRNKRLGIIFAIAAALCIALAVTIPQMVQLSAEKKVAYENAVNLMAEGDYDNAITAFEACSGYKDSAALITECENAEAYAAAMELKNSKDYYNAALAFARLGDYSDSSEQYAECFNAVSNESATAAAELKAEVTADTELTQATPTPAATASSASKNGTASTSTTVSTGSSSSANNSKTASSGSWTTASSSSTSSSSSSKSSTSSSSTSTTSSGTGTGTSSNSQSSSSGSETSPSSTDNKSSGTESNTSSDSSSSDTGSTSTASDTNTNSDCPELPDCEPDGYGLEAGNSDNVTQGETGGLLFDEDDE